MTLFLQILMQPFHRAYYAAQVARLVATHKLLTLHYELVALRALPQQVLALHGLVHNQRERLNEKAAALDRLEQGHKDAAAALQQLQQMQQEQKEAAPLLDFLASDIEAEGIRQEIIDSRVAGGAITSVAEDPRWQAAWETRGQKVRALAAARRGRAA